MICDEENSALSVQKGVVVNDNDNAEAIRKFKQSRKKIKTAEEYFSGIRNGEISSFASAITLIESTLPDHSKIADQIIQLCMPHSGNSVRIGITGVPGAGKSTFIEAFGMFLTNLGKKVAVLAVDPSGERTKGSILGDKTRMERLGVSPHAFIRPSPSAGTSGGVARKTAESIILCEAAGFDVIIVETVGVGQSETAVHSMTDFFLLLMLAGAGDELQGIKRGIMEMADAVVINKADGANILNAQRAAVEYKNALHYFPPSESGVEPQTTYVSAKDETGIDRVWEMIENYVSQTTGNGYFNKNRAEQARFRMRETIEEQLKQRFYNNEKRRRQIETIEKAVAEGQMTPYYGARLILDLDTEN